MNSINKTLYIPLYGKSYVSQKGLLLRDPKAEEVWAREGFSLKRKSRSKYLCYYMAMRTRVFDEWLKEKMKEFPSAVILHPGCGLDSRVLRVGTLGHTWYDIDFISVIGERKKYFHETPEYQMLCGDLKDPEFLNAIPKQDHALVVMEGVSMYVNDAELKTFLASLCAHFSHISLLVDCYSVWAARLSALKNPVREVGVSQVYGVNDPKALESSGLRYLREREITPESMISELSGIERRLFQKLYSGSISKKLYRLYEFEK